VSLKQNWRTHQELNLKPADPQHLSKDRAGL
jgi:hypothetical protein